MKLHVPSFQRARVLVIGDLMLDRYWQGSTSRISPEAPVPVVHVRDLQARAGGAGNVALNVAALGAQATVDGLVGDDEPGRALRAMLLEADVRCAFTPATDIPTITKLRVLSRHQQLIRLDFEESFERADLAPLHERCCAAFAHADVVVLSDYAKGTLARVADLVRLAREHGVPCLVDPKGTGFEKYRGATLLTPNLGEFEAVVGHCRDEDDIARRGEMLRGRLELQALLVTRGEHGMTLLRDGEAPLHLPAHAREVYDVTGAGDTVISTLAACLAAGLPISEATALANIAAGMVVGKLGAATVSVPELRAAVAAKQEAPLVNGLLDEAALMAVVERAKALGERIVFTNGCFDLLHAGHVRYLQEARKLGDRLIVAVNDDASVRRLKGVARPINPLASRMEVLAALRCVDWVVPFGEDTPERLIGDVVPHVLVKGGDYRPEDIAGGACVRAHGGEVVVLAYHPGHSTTGVVARIQSGADE